MKTKKTTVKKKENLEKNSNFKKELEKLKSELKEKNDKFLRSIADFQNYQKRMEKERIDKERECRTKYLQEFIDLYEILQKVYQDNDPKSGLKILLQKIEQFFEKEHIKYIECIGKTFDHNYHHAISTIEKNDCVDGTIVEEVKKGYFLNEKLLRPAQVIVVKNKITTDKEVS